MADKTGIQWTETTWNPLVGCAKVSEGCRNCYAMVMAARIANSAQERLRRGLPLTDRLEAYRRVVRWKRGGMFAADEHDEALPQWNNRVELVESALLEPLAWSRPRLVFVNSMSDLFHEAVPFEFIDKVFAAMALCSQHTFQVLTKRPERMAEYLLENDGLTTPLRVEHQVQAMRGKEAGDRWAMGLLAWPLPNIWLGTSVENQKAADQRIPHLLRCPAAVRFLSCEPLLGPVDLRHVDLGDQTTQGYGLRRITWDALTRWEHQSKAGQRLVDGDTVPCSVSGRHPRVNWVIVGGESGPNARPMHPEWARSLRDQSLAAGVPFFYKQWGEYQDGSSGHGQNFIVLNDGSMYPSIDEEALLRLIDNPDHVFEWPRFKPTIMAKVGKHRAGRLLDGREWNEYPEAPRG